MRWIRSFGRGEAEGGRGDVDLLGGKGAQLAEMTRLGLDVPPGFTVTTEACRAWLGSGEVPPGLREELAEALALLESRMGRRLGDTRAEPLLVSVRSGAPVSMPGMMDTVLDLGVNDGSVAALARASGEERFAHDCHRRFVQMYGEVVAGVPREVFEEELTALKRSRGVSEDTDLTAEDLERLVHVFRTAVESTSGRPFPDDPDIQLIDTIGAVFRSWDNERARDYRRVHRIPDDLGTAANVMAMVYGNLSERSGSGVVFTRDPATGAPGLYGEFLPSAQGEDVVAGTRDPIPIADFTARFPDLAPRLEELRGVLERHYGDMQDIEFTVDRGRLWILQTRTGKRTARAAVKIAVDLVDEGLVDRRTALLRVEPDGLDQLLHPIVDPAAEAREIGRGLAASPGAAVGRAVFSSATARAWVEEGERVVLMRPETSADDFGGMVVAEGIVTSRGGMTSHAAVVARGLGKCCIVRAVDLEVDEAAGLARCNGHRIAEGDWLTLDGGDGRILEGRVATVEPEVGGEVDRLLRWADGARRLAVRANADTPEDAVRARRFGAEGVGLCRTEHMLLEESRLAVVRRMILAADDAERDAALDRLEALYRSDFVELFRAMDGLPFTIRLLDPPLHEFLPGGETEIAALARDTGRTPDEIRALVERQRESNPMLGRRGVRLAVVFPRIAEMQARAIFHAAVDAAEQGFGAGLEVMIPLVVSGPELRDQRAIVDRVAGEVFAARGRSLAYTVGTMVELPRAALVAGTLAEHADFFSFGTNDLTQTTLGISRDDAGTFLPLYVERGYLPADPFRTLDVAGVGALVRTAVTEGLRARPGLEVGVCGEHAGDPASIDFFHGAGIDHLSCSPYRVPVARLAAAQAALRAPETPLETAEVPPGGSERRANGPDPLSPPVAGGVVPGPAAG